MTKTKKKTRKLSEAEKKELKTKALEKLNVTGEDLEVEEFAAYLDFHPVSLSNWRVSGDGPKFRKRGRFVVYPVKEIRVWEEKQIKRCTV